VYAFAARGSNSPTRGGQAAFGLIDARGSDSRQARYPALGTVRSPGRIVRMHSAIERDEVVAASALTRIELSIGMRLAERRATDALGAALHWLAVDRAVADEADALARALRPESLRHRCCRLLHRSVRNVHELELWTINVRHFPMFEGLRPPW
jgi:predicted nucleic acid-binding protein